MSTEAVSLWKKTLSEIYRNRRHLVPIDWDKEHALTATLGVIYVNLTVHEWGEVPKFVPPVLPDPQVHDKKGHLLGVQCRCNPESIPVVVFDASEAAE